jgi:hypothetical protein
MYDVDRKLYDLACHNKGVITLIAALAAGVSRAAVDRRVMQGVLIVMHPGIYRHAAVPFSQDLRDLAAVLACGADSVLSHRSAAARHRFPGVRRARPEVTSPHTDLPRVDGVTRHRSLWLPACEIVTIDGIRVTAKGRTAMDYCAVTPLAVAEEALREAVITKLLSPAAVFATLDRSGGRGRPGTAALRTIASRFDDLEGLESMLELLVAGVVDTAAVPTPNRQVPFTCADGREVRFDLSWLDRGIALDANGRRGVS